MHSELDISIKNLSKIEGHTHLDIKVRGGKVVEAKLKVSENKRFYLQAMRGLNFRAAPHQLSRICGTCSAAHIFASMEAVEKALEVKPSQQTVLMRKLLMNGSHIRDHAMHLYFFVLPDLLGKDSVLDFGKKEKAWLDDAFDVKRAGNSLATLLGGRAVHPIYPQVGHFLKVPEKEKVREVVKELKSVRDKVVRLVEFLHSCPFTFKRKTNYVAMVNKDFSFLEGEIQSTEGVCIPESEYYDHLLKVIIPYSTSSGYEFEGREFMVGALARFNTNRSNLHPQTKKEVASALKTFPSECIYHNNLAQAIETLHCIDFSIEKLESEDFEAEPRPKITPKAGTGVGVVEAPRGTLYYYMAINKSGLVENGNIVIPTSQNTINIERDIRELVPRVMDRGKAFVQAEVEKLVRAYDPCMSCATHFLKINWI